MCPGRGGRSGARSGERISEGQVRVGGADREGPCVLLRPWGLSVPGGELSLNDGEWQKEDTVRSEFQEGDCAG